MRCCATNNPGVHHLNFNTVAEGKRGMAILVGANTEYEDVEPLTAMAHANANTLLAVIIETKEALENVEDILIPGIDLALVGFQDLSQHLGIPGEFTNPLIREAGAKVRALCQQRGIATAGAIDRPANAQSALHTAAHFLFYGPSLPTSLRHAPRAPS